MNGNVAAPTPNPLTNGPVQSHPGYPSAPQTPVSFTPEQIDALRAQIQAFKLISRGMAVPDHIQQSMRVPNHAVPELERVLHGPNPNARIIDNTVKLHKSLSSSSIAPTPAPTLPPDGVPSTSVAPPAVPTPAVDASAVATATPADVTKIEEAVEVMPLTGDMPRGPFIEDDSKSGIYPYNAFLHPFSHLKRDPNVNPALWATRLQRLLVPSIMPAGLDPHQIVAERNRFVDARIEWRIRELENMPATMGEGGLDPALADSSDAMKVDPSSDGVKTKDGEKIEDKENTDLSALILRPKTQVPPFPGPETHGKLRALIELKSLRVLDKQRALRAMVAERLTHGSLLPLNRTDFRRTRKPTLRDTRMTEQAERKQRVERERRAKQKHVEQLSIICKHGEEVISFNRNSQQGRVTRLGKNVVSFHQHTEREEQKRIERLAKERLKALKADDEVAYMKLIDTAKDTRITHLLRQTDGYLDSLAQAVMEQQKEDPHPHSNVTEVEDGPTSEATFGATKMENVEEDKGKLDYYAVAHRIKEKVTKQPSILIGGTLKEYQLKGLQWMVSLYNNKLNGILADEMVSVYLYCIIS